MKSAPYPALFLLLVLATIVVIGCHRHRDARDPGDDAMTPPATPDDAGAPRLPPGHPPIAPTVTAQPGDVQL